jgi:hypothetical protein
MSTIACDTTFANQLPATYTSIDLANARKYAEMRLLKEKMEAYNKVASGSVKPLKWVDRYSTGGVSYMCPDSLKNLTAPNRCVEGIVRIATKAECKAKSTFDYNKFKSNEKHLPGIENGYPLIWLPPAKVESSPDGRSSKVFDFSNSDNGDCYMENFIYKKACEDGFYRPDEKSVGSKNCETCGSQVKNTLKYEPDTGRCLITQDYCHAAGFTKYTAPNGVDFSTAELFRSKPPLPPGGKCELGAGQRVADLFIGSTFARGIVGGACPFMKGK